MKSTTQALKMNDSFRQFLILSIVLHTSLALFMLIKGIIMPSNVLEFTDAIRVDMVDLPDKIDREAKPAPIEKKEKVEKPQPKPEVKKVELPTEKPVDLSETRKKALEKIKALEAIEKIKKEMADKQVKATAAQKTQLLKGTIISSGNDFSGLSKLKVNEYLSKLKGRIQQHWELPQWLSSANLKATVIIQIDDRGYIVKNEIHASSGNGVFDSLCVDAVSKTSPVDPPPSEVQGALITIRFPFE